MALAGLAVLLSPAIRWKRGGTGGGAGFHLDMSASQAQSWENKQMESAWVGGMVEPRGEAGRLQEGNLEGICRGV